MSLWDTIRLIPRSVAKATDRSYTFQVPALPTSKGAWAD